MSIVVKCHCGWEGTVDDPMAGQSVRCAACGKLLPLPATPTPAGSPSESRRATFVPAPAPVQPDTAAAPPGPPWKTRLTAALNQVVQILRPAWDYVRDAFQFYQTNWDTVRDGGKTLFGAALDNPQLLSRQVRMGLHDQHGLVDDHGLWRVDFPARCVVCGAKVTGEWIEERRMVLDPYGPIVLPLGGLAVGLIIGWWYTSLLWLVGAPVGGVVLGYTLRRRDEFLLRFVRCKRHTEHKQIPEVCVLNRQFILRLGSREAKMAYLGQGGDYAPSDEAYVPPSEPPPRPLPQSIALAESAHPDTAIIPEEPDRLPGTKDDDDQSYRVKN